MPWTRWIGRSVLSVVAVTAALALGYAVGIVKPFHALSDAPGPRAPGRAAGAEEDGTPPAVPAPPGAVLTHSMTYPDGWHARYESSMDLDSLWAFYVHEMARAGWARDAAFDRARAAAGEEAPVLSFTASGARCIIGLDEEEPFKAAANVLVVAVPRPGAVRARGEHAPASGSGSPRR